MFVVPTQMLFLIASPLMPHLPLACALSVLLELQTKAQRLALTIAGQLALCLQ
jgi:hypothetical protein